MKKKFRVYRVCTNIEYADVEISKEEYGDSVPTIMKSVDEGLEISSRTPGFDNTALTL